MTPKERETKSAQWRTDNLCKNAVLSDVIVPKDMFYCQKPIDYKPKSKCQSQCGLCAIFEGKRQ